MTSIEWLIDQMFRQGYFDGNKPLSITNLDHLQQQAVEMQKAEIEEAFKHGKLPPFLGQVQTAKEYYQETFVSKGSDECYFEPTNNTSSATICKHCSREKFLHKT